MSKQWKVYLSGEIHSDWRERIVQAASDLPVEFTAPVTASRGQRQLAASTFSGRKKAAFGRTTKARNSTPSAPAP